MSVVFLDDSDDDDLFTDYEENLRRFMAATATDLDLDFAFNLQLQEAINASLSVQQPPLSTSSPTSVAGPSYTVGETSGSSSVTSPTSVAGPSYTVGETSGSSSVTHSVGQLRLDRLNFSLAVPERFEDEKPKHEVGKIAEELSEEDENHYKREFGQGIFRNVTSEIFRVYCKGLIEKSWTPQNFRSRNGGLNVNVLCGIGVSICDSKGKSIFDIGKPLHDNSMCRQGAEVKALIEGLNIASAFGIQRVIYHCDYHPIYQYVTGRWTPKQRKVEALVSQLFQLRKKFTYCIPKLVSTNEILLACSLAKEAIELQKVTPPDSSGVKIFYETCVICLEVINTSQIFSVDVCKHRYCYSCMKRHVEAKLWGGMLPKCPHEGCKSELKVDSCSKFLTPNLVELMTQRLKEASIPVTDRLYCPYPKCSALMSKMEVLLSKATIPMRSCIKCNGQFCIVCNVPWHAKMACFEYKTRYPDPSPSERWLKYLAQTQSWHQCAKCQHMIELAEGCYHMTCRCGYEFCYTCGAEYKDKKATCKCPSWDEDFILASDEEWEEDDDDDEWEEDDDDEGHIFII